MVRYIPLELVHLIASSALVLDRDSSEENRRARFALAKSLSLVCRQWRRVGQAALFHTFFLYVGQQDGFLRERQRSHLFSLVRDLVVIGGASSAKLDKKLMRCRLECDELRRVCLEGPAVWPTWFNRTSRIAPVSSVVDFSLVANFVDQSHLPGFVRVLQGAALMPNATKFAVQLRAEAHPTMVLPTLAGATRWAQVRDLAVSIDHFMYGQYKDSMQSSFLRELPNLFLLDRLASLELEQLREEHVDSHLPLLQQATSLERLVLGYPSCKLREVAVGLGPTLAGMPALKGFTLRSSGEPERFVGDQALPPSLLAHLPRTLVDVDVDMYVNTASLAAEAAFLEDRLDSPLERWTTTSVDTDACEPMRWVKGVDERGGTRVWKRE